MTSRALDGTTSGEPQETTRLPGQPFRFIGILHHPKKPESIHLAAAMGDFLRSTGVEEIWYESAWESEAVLEHLPNVDLLITLGGDGTLLRAARLGARYGVPMLGVKMGRLGFLAEVLPDDWQRPLERMLRGDYWLEERLMVRACLERPAGSQGAPATVCEYDALNDVVLSRGALARVVRISVELDGGYLTTYTCDGLIVSTATGSTGYALAVDGPILPPELRNILVIPIAPHLSMDRAIVLSEGTEVRLQAFVDHEAMLTVDGQFVIEVLAGDTIVVTGSPHLARFIRLRERSYFYKALMEKLRWPDGKEHDS
ncbi:MAG TPA: NAD(+)/NADH kinase [Caldilineaceae bacterium]|nr:NAD(+)/NADH kinase [Caldilineaceae bacterium]